MHDNASRGLIEPRAERARVEQCNHELLECAHVVGEPERFEQSVVAKEAVRGVGGAAEYRELAELQEGAIGERRKRVSVEGVIAEGAEAEDLQQAVVGLWRMVEVFAAMCWPQTQWGELKY